MQCTLMITMRRVRGISCHGNATMTTLCTTDVHITTMSIKTPVLPRERNVVYDLRSYRATKYIVLP
jgi:hypothetical protein